MSTIWIATESGFQRGKIIDRHDSYIVSLTDQGQVVLPQGAPNGDFYPAYFEQENEPKVFEIKGRFLRVREKEDYGNPELGEQLIPEEEPYLFLSHARKVAEGAIGSWDPKEKRLVPDAQFLVGPAGVGKTSLVMQLAARIKQPAIRVNITSQMLGDVLFGQMALINGETKWIDGPVTVAARNGYWLVLDEFDFLNPEVSSYFYPLLEPKPSLYLKDKPGGESVKIHPGFRVFASGNCMGEESEKYHGTQPINHAILDRFSSGQIIKVQRMSAKQEKNVLSENRPHVSENVIKRAVRVAEKIRGKGRGPYPDLSTRQLVNWIDKMLLTGRTLDAANRTWLPLVKESVREDATKIIQRYGGKYVRPIIGKTTFKPQTPVQVGGPEVKERLDALKENAVGSKGRTSSEFSLEEMRPIYEARKLGLSFSRIEKEFGLRDANGMNAHRIVRKYEKAKTG